MKRKTARTVITLALVLGVLILSWRGITFTAPSRPMLPPSFVMKLDGSAYSCTMRGSQADCTVRSVARH